MRASRCTSATQIPDLYKAMSRVLLNQDPLNCLSGNTTIILRPETASTLKADLRKKLPPKSPPNSVKQYS